MPIILEKVIFWLTGKSKKSSSNEYNTSSSIGTPGVSGQLLTSLDGVSLLRSNANSVDQVDEEEPTGFL